MKYLARAFVFSVFTLWLASQFISGLEIKGGVFTFLVAGGVFTLLDFIIKPMLKILFIPINLLTLGLAGWFINVIILYLLTVLVYDVRVNPWTTPPFHFVGIVLPSFSLGLFVTFIFISLVITAMMDILHNISDT